MLLKFITILWLAFMLILSHIPGGPSGEESRWLASMTGVKESVLRRSMHVALYLILAVLVMVGWTDTPLWARIVALVIIAVIDESSKGLSVFRERHCNVYPDMLLNLVGVGVGVGVGTAIGVLI